MKESDRDFATDKLVRDGAQYYVAGRFAVMAQLMPVAANLLHHCIEMLLKAAMLKVKARTLEECRDLKHDLRKIWQEFKTQTNDSKLDAFEKVIEELDKFEDLRYPEKMLQNGGAAMLFDITKASRGFIHGTRVPVYALCLEEIDELVCTIFDLVGWNHKVYLRFNEEGQHYADVCNLWTKP